MDVIVLGAGLVGAPMAMDLNRDSRFRVTVADYSEDALKNFSRNRELPLSVSSVTISL